MRQARMKLNHGWPSTLGETTVIAIVEYMEESIVQVRIPADIQKRVEKLQADGKCLGCERKLETDEQVRCGDCDACYQAAIRAIDKKKITRKKLIESGKMLPPSKGGRKPSNPFTQELAEL